MPTTIPTTLPTGSNWLLPTPHTPLRVGSPSLGGSSISKSHKREITKRRAYRRASLSTVVLFPKQIDLAKPMERQEAGRAGTRCPISATTASLPSREINTRRAVAHVAAAAGSASKSRCTVMSLIRPMQTQANLLQANGLLPFATVRQSSRRRRCCCRMHTLARAPGAGAAPHARPISVDAWVAAASTPKAYVSSPPMRLLTSAAVSAPPRQRAHHAPALAVLRAVSRHEPKEPYKRKHASRVRRPLTP